MRLWSLQTYCDGRGRVRWWLSSDWATAPWNSCLATLLLLLQFAQRASYKASPGTAQHNEVFWHPVILYAAQGLSVLLPCPFASQTTGFFENTEAPRGSVNLVPLAAKQQDTEIMKNIYSKDHGKQASDDSGGFLLLLYKEILTLHIRKKGGGISKTELRSI